MSSLTTAPGSDPWTAEPLEERRRGDAHSEDDGDASPGVFRERRSSDLSILSHSMMEEAVIKKFRDRAQSEEHEGHGVASPLSNASAAVLVQDEIKLIESDVEKNLLESRINALENQNAILEGKFADLVARTTEDADRIKSFGDVPMGETCPATAGKMSLLKRSRLGPRVGALLLRAMYTTGRGIPPRIEDIDAATAWAAVDVWRRKLCEEGCVEDHDRWRLLQGTMNTGGRALQRLQGIKDRVTWIGGFVMPRVVQRAAQAVEVRAMGTLEPWRPLVENCAGHVHSIVGHIDDSVDKQVLVPVTRRVRGFKENVRRKRREAVDALVCIPTRALRAASPWVAR